MSANRTKTGRFKPGHGKIRKTRRKGRKGRKTRRRKGW